jgi:MFS family permease
MTLRIAFALLFFSFGSVSAARVLLTLYALALGADPFGVGMLTASFYLCPLLFSWPIGRLADRHGARWLVLAGTVCGMVGLLVAFAVARLEALFVAAVLTGLSFAFYLVTLQNLIGVLSSPAERARNFRTFSMIGATTNFIGPLIAGFSIDHLGHALAAAAIALLPLGGALVLIAFGRRLPGGSGTVAAAHASVVTLLRDRAIVQMLLTSSLVQLGTDLYQFYIPIYGHGLGLSASSIGAVLASFATASFLVRFALTRLIARFGEERVLTAAFALGAAGFVLVPLCQNASSLAAAAFVFGLGMACGQPITTMLMFSRSVQGRSGEMLGLRLTANNLMRVAGPAVFGLVAAAVGLAAVFGLNALMMLGGAFASRPRRRDDDQ